MINCCKSAVLLLIFLTCQQLSCVAQSDIIDVPIKFVNAYLPFDERNPITFESDMYRQAWSNPLLEKCLPQLTGIPKGWTDVYKKFIWFDFHQFMHQSRQTGKITAAEYDSLVKVLYLTPGNRVLSDRPIRCFVASVCGKDKKGVLRYKLDLNHNLNFADDPIQSPAGETAQLEKLHPNDGKDTVQYETIRNGSVVKKQAFLEMYPGDSVVRVQIPNHAVGKLDDQSLFATSGNYGSTDYEIAKLYLTRQRMRVPSVDEAFEKDYLTIGKDTYQYLGVRSDREVMQFKKLPRDTVVYGAHAGVYAPNFRIKDTKGNLVDLSQYRGKYVYIEFWTDWTLRLVEERVHTHNAYVKSDRSKVEFLRFVLLESESEKSSLDNYTSGWKQIVLNDRWDIMRDYRLSDIPMNFLIDPNGKILLKDIDGKDLVDAMALWVK